MTDIQIFYDGPIVNRANAMALGQNKYFTGKPCKHGHVDQRRVDNTGCCSCNRISRSKYDRKHKEIIYRRRKDYRKRKAHEIRLSKRDYNRYNQESISKKRRKYRLENPELLAASNRNRHALKLNAKGTHTKKDIIKILTDQNHKCAEPTCQIDISDGYHVDHIMPLSKGGSNWPKNLQCLCPPCNLRKGPKHPIDWAQENGRLF